MSKYLVAKKFFKNKVQSSDESYDAEVEYLESTGTQWINTGINANSIYGLKFEFMCRSSYAPDWWNSVLAGVLDNFTFGFQYMDNDYYYIRYRGVDIGRPYAATDEWNTLTIDDGYISLNDFSSSESTPIATSSGNLIICNNSGFSRPSNICVKSLQIYSASNVLARDLIPVRKGNIGYMYDKVSGKLFGNSGSGNFILGQDTAYPEVEEPEETPSTKFIVGKHHSENISQNNQFSVIKKQFKTKINLEFDSQGGTSHEQQEVILGETYGELPVPTKSQNIFIGWFTDTTSGNQITKDSIVELNITKLYARWEYVQIDSDFTSYSVTTNSSYRNTGIYTASIADSSQPIYIDWGDGTVEKTNSSISQKSHTYKTNGNFTVKISNNITSFAPSYNNSTWYGTTSQNRYTFKGMLTTGSKVTSLPTYAFYYCSAMTNIDFMETCWTTVTSLPNYCFCYCSGLTSIQGAERFTSLGSYCFQYCTGLSGVQDLSNFKFTSLTNSYVFANCSNVKRWILPTIFNGTTFGSYMFYNNTQLSGFGQELSETITQDIVEIEYLESTGTQWIDTETNVGQNTFNIDFKAQFSVDENNALYLIGIGTSTSYTGTGIAFGTHNNKWSAIFPGITYNEFGTYTNNAVSFIFNVDFNACHISGYDTATFNNTGNSLTNSAQWRNDQCTIRIFKVTDQTIPSSGKIYTCKIYIGNSFVRDLIPVRVGNTGYMYDKVSGQLFGNQGTGNFVLGPDKENGFQTQIEQQIFSNALPNTLTSVGSYCFQNCSNLNNIIIPSKVQSIGNYAFHSCTSLNNVNIEATNLTAINQYAFYNCSKLTDLDLPDTVNTIGNYAFYGCTSLDYAGQMANDLPYDAEIEYLEAKYISSQKGPWIDTSASDIDEYEIKWQTSTPTFDIKIFGNSYAYEKQLDCSIYQSKYRGTTISTDITWDVINVNIPNKTLSIYRNNELIGKTTSWWSAYSQNNTVLTYGEKVPLFGHINQYGGNFNGNVVTTAGGGAITRISRFKAWKNNILVKDFIPVRIGNTGYMYDKISNQIIANEDNSTTFILGPDVKTKELPSQLTSIGSYAYQCCSNLKSLNIPENLQTIGDYAFAGCYQISSIVDKRLTAQTVSTNTFGSATGTSNTAFTGYQTKGNNILSTYFAATGYDENAWDDPLQNPDKCGFVQQYIDPENVVSCTVTFDVGIGNISEATKSIIKGKKIGTLPVPTVIGEEAYFGGWSPVADDIDSIIDEDYKVTSDMTLYAVYSSNPFANYEVILNNQWQASSKTNPDTSKYDGVYESFSNYNQSSKAAVMYIKIKGYSKFTIYIRSYAESSYDYTVAFNLDTYTPSKPLTSNPSSSTSGVKAHTSGKQNGGTAIGNYTKVEYTGIDSKEHYICVAYRKDSSVNNSDDRGYILIEKQGSGTFEPVKYININFEVGEGTLVSGETTTIDVQGSTLSRIPEISAPASKPYFIGWNTQADGSGEYYDNTTILPNLESLTLYAYYVAEDPIDPNKDIYLCFTAEQVNSTIQLSAMGTAPTVYLETSRTCNNVLEGWSDFVVGETTITLENVDDKIYFRAKQDNNVFATNTSNYNKFVMTGKIAASGNLNTLLKADGSVLDLTGRNYCYSYMFSGCTSLTQAPLLPATTLAIYCYYSMFYNCTKLTQAPELPATTLANWCYAYMFSYCYVLTKAPALLVETLATYCYRSMFEGCTSLTQTPALPATTLASNCYSYMFTGCTKLTQAPELPATGLATYCYRRMFEGCTSLIQVPELPAMTLVSNCYNNMFYSCTSLTQAPELPATTLADYCYYEMFNGCTSLTKAPALPATRLANYCYNSMFQNCTKLTQAPELPATTLTSHCYFYMFSGCKLLTQAPELPATTLAESCYASIFKDCTSLTQAPALPATRLTPYCYNAMFYNCTSLTQAPELPVTALADSCYSNMFYGCINLTQAPELPATTLANQCYYYMFKGCTSLTQAPALPATTLAKSCYYGMFLDCTKLTQAPALPAKTLDVTCYMSMFQKCTALTQAPVLPATTLAESCYDRMFHSCTSLIQAPELPATTLANQCYVYMFYGCTSLTQAPVLPATTLAERCYGNMFQKCTNLNSINVNFSAWNPANATTDWVTNVSSSGTFICPEDLPETYGTSYIPTNWTIKSSYWGLCFTAEEANSKISMTKGESAPAVSLYTSPNGRNWTVFIPNETVITLTNVGDTVYFKSGESGNVAFASGYNLQDTNRFSMSGKIAASGNIMSLLNGEEPASVFSANRVFAYLFHGCSTLTKAKLEMPVTTLTKGCYQCMFQYCTNLTQAPELPATTLADYCYDCMFMNCSSLTTSIELPATNLITGCYAGMFSNCTQISNITTNILEWSQTNATNYWLDNVSTTGTFTCYENLPQERGPNRIPDGWTIDNSITKDPNLSSYLCFTAEEPNSTIAIEKVGTAPDVSLKTTINGIMWQPFTVGETSITLANVGDKVYFKANENDNTQFATSTSIYNKFVMTGKVAASGNIQSLLYKDEIINEFPATYCYTGLFRDCSALTQAPELPVEQLSSNCYGYMFNGCTSLSTPPILPATSLLASCYANMFANCIALTSTPQLPAENIASRCYNGMFTNCISLTSMPELPATTLKTACYSTMFKGCTSLSSTTLLPATTLVATCYSNMFNGCSSLTSINVNLSAWNIATGTTNWLSGVSDIGVFNCPESLPETRGVSNIPINWEIVRK